MRTTVAIDSELVAKLQSFTGLTEKSSLLRKALSVRAEIKLSDISVLA